MPAIDQRISDVYRHSGFFALRAPVLPYTTWLAWGARVEAPHADPGELRDALERDAAALRVTLREWLNRPRVREAIFLASPTLDTYVDHWLQEPTSQRGRRAEKSLVKYFARMTGRSTPFGLFSGCCAGEIGTETQLEVGGIDAHQRTTRPDMQFLDRLVRQLCRDSAIRQQLTFRPNDSLYRVGHRARYIEARYSGSVCSYVLVDVDCDSTLAGVLGRAESGATLKELVAIVVNEGESLEDARRYVDDVVDAQILVPDLAVCITGEPPLDTLVQRLSRIPAASSVRELLIALRGELLQLDAQPAGNSPARYRTIAAGLHKLPVEVDTARLFQVDTQIAAKAATLSAGVVTEVLRATQVLHRLFGRKASDHWAEFRRAFRARYEEREIPLTEVLDDDLGIGFGTLHGPGADVSPLLAGLDLPGTRSERQETLDACHDYIGRRLVETLSAGRQTLVVTDADVERLPEQQRLPLPDAFDAMFSILAGADADGLVSPQVYFRGAGGPSGARLLARFSHADQMLHQKVVEHLTEEEALDADAVFFEIVHLPEGRVGNIIARPLLRKYELPFLGCSGAPQSHQLRISDVTVGVRGERVVLRSRALGCEVVPRLTTAHNTNRRTIAVYRFLAALQTQQVTESVSWRWRGFGTLPYLPRVQYGCVILAPQTWRISRDEAQHLTDGDEAECFRRVQQWRIARGVPRYVGLADWDNVLPIDLCNTLSVATLLDELRTGRYRSVQELLPESANLLVRGKEGGYIHEFVVPFIRKVPHKQASPLSWRPPAVMNGRASRAQRCYPPGCEWLYLKIYCGHGTADTVLQNCVADIVRTAASKYAATRWFFIRYADPQPHLRLRFYGEPMRMTSGLLPEVTRLLRTLLEDGTVWKLQVDTYEPELERYGGGAAMGWCEAIFHADSIAALRLLPHLVGDESSNDRWLATLVGLHCLFDDFAFDLSERYAIIQRRADEAAAEVGLAGRVRQRMLEKYRTESGSIQEWLGTARVPNAKVRLSRRAWQARSAAAGPAAAAIRALAAKGELSVSVEDVIVSLLHMHTNRMTRGGSRAQETVLYQYLARYYRSLIARK